jgi:RHS repeat-associated protein
VTQGTTSTEAYTFDPVGNRLSSLAVPSYTINNSNEVIAAGSSSSYTYDNDGNTLSKTDSTGTTTFTWDFENRLTSVHPPGQTTVTFKYDPFGRRIQKGTSVYLYNGANLIEEVDTGTNIVARYVFGTGIDEPLAAYRGAMWEFYQADGLGSITSLSTNPGTVSDSFVYDSFGNVASSTGVFVQPFRYTGREWDAETGLYYYRARYYDPAVGRFLNEDPIGFKGGNNFYAYVGNNPQNWADPSGLLFSPEQCRAIKEILRRERLVGTAMAALVSGVSSPWSDGLLGVFNSTYVPDFQSPLGPINLDWFSDLEASNAAFYTFPSFVPIAFVRYGILKTAWIGIRAVNFPGAPPVTNFVPYSAPGERNAAWQASKPWIGYKDIFTPEFVQKECPCPANSHK